MQIGDKVVIVDDTFYKGRYGRILDVITGGMYRVKVDIDDRVIDVNWEAVEPATEYHDNHYKTLSVQPIILAQDILTPEQLEGALMFNIIKYSLRAGHKNGESIEKDEAKKNRYKEWLNIVRSGKKIVL